MRCGFTVLVLKKQQHAQVPLGVHVVRFEGDHGLQLGNGKFRLMLVEILLRQSGMSRSLISCPRRCLTERRKNTSDTQQQSEDFFFARMTSA